MSIANESGARCCDDAGKSRQEQDTSEVYIVPISAVYQSSWKWSGWNSAPALWVCSFHDWQGTRPLNFDPVKSLVDILMHETMADKDMYSMLWNVVRMLLILSHGQAAVERDFNKQASWRSSSAGWNFCCQENYMRSCEVVGGIDQVDVACRVTPGCK